MTIIKMQKRKDREKEEEEEEKFLAFSYRIVDYKLYTQFNIFSMLFDAYVVGG
jgi:hypothetical protein